VVPGTFRLLTSYFSPSQYPHALFLVVMASKRAARTRATPGQSAAKKRVIAEHSDADAAEERYMEEAREMGRNLMEACTALANTLCPGLLGEPSLPGTGSPPRSPLYTDMDPHLYAPDSPAYQPTSPAYDPTAPEYVDAADGPTSPAYVESPAYNPVTSDDESAPAPAAADARVASEADEDGREYRDYHGLALLRNGSVWAPKVVCHEVDTKCSICLEEYKDACKGVVICSLGKHSVCTSCLRVFMDAVNAAASTRQLRLASACPTCRSPLATTLILPSPPASCQSETSEAALQPFV
jgi:hypothetical protein